jgi:hypothetical protein
LYPLTNLSLSSYLPPLPSCITTILLTICMRSTFLDSTSEWQHEVLAFLTLAYLT